MTALNNLAPIGTPYRGSTPREAARPCCVHPTIFRRLANFHRRRRGFGVDGLGSLTRRALFGDVITFPFLSGGKQKGCRRWQSPASRLFSVVRSSGKYVSRSTLQLRVICPCVSINRKYRASVSIVSVGVVEEATEIMYLQQRS